MPKKKEEITIRSSAAFLGLPEENMKEVIEWICIQKKN